MTAPTASVLPISSGGWNGSFEYQLDSSQTVANSVFYELHHINGVIQGDHHGIELRNVNGVTFVFVNTASNSSSPDQCYRVRNGVTSATSDNVSIEANDELYILSSTANNPVKGVITITSSMLWSTGGVNPLSVSVVQWSAFFSKNAGDEYWRWTVTGLNTDASDNIYLYDGMPGGTNIPNLIGIRSFAASSSSSTQFGLFIPDVTKTYYVVNLVNSTFVVLASKNFAKKKVFCNFW